MAILNLRRKAGCSPNWIGWIQKSGALMDKHHRAFGMHYYFLTLTAQKQAN